MMVKRLLLSLLLLSTSLKCIGSENISNIDFENTVNESSSVNLLYTKLTVETYHQLVSTLTTLYDSTNFTPDICKSYFNDSDLSNMVALPFIITPGENFYFEVFGQMYDSQYQYLSRMDEGSMMYGFHYQSAISEKNLSNFAMGFGLSVKLDDNINMKTLFSNKEIPGYGRNNVAVGLEIDF